MNSDFNKKKKICFCYINTNTANQFFLKINHQITKRHKRSRWFNFLSCVLWNNKKHKFTRIKIVKRTIVLAKKRINLLRAFIAVFTRKNHYFKTFITAHYVEDIDLYKRFNDYTIQMTLWNLSEALKRQEHWWSPFFAVHHRFF
jgi:hypothetical protein